MTDSEKPKPTLYDDSLFSEKILNISLRSPAFTQLGAKINAKAVQESNEIKCETHAVKPFTKYILETFPVYNNRRVSQGLVFEVQTDPGGM